MCYTRRKIEGGVGALRESDDANFLKPNGQSRNLHVYGLYSEFISLQGWGLYSEFLGGEDMLNVVLTEEERLGQLSYESLRSARLVVDTGIHFYK